MSRIRLGASLLAACAALSGCAEPTPESSYRSEAPLPGYFLNREKTHNKFSRGIPPSLRVPSGAVVEVETKEATDGQLTPPRPRKTC